MLDCPECSHSKNVSPFEDDLWPQPFALSLRRVQLSDHLDPAESQSTDGIKKVLPAQAQAGLCFSGLQSWPCEAGLWTAGTASLQQGHCARLGQSGFLLGGGLMILKSVCYRWLPRDQGLPGCDPETTCIWIPQETCENSDSWALSRFSESKSLLENQMINVCFINSSGPGTMVLLKLCRNHTLIVSLQRKKA